MKSHWQILIVDDEAVMCGSIAAWLREDGYTVDTAGSGAAALELARAHTYAMCFIDLKMPGGMDGIETMRGIRRLQPETAFIIITAYATVDTAITALKEGALEYIVKPCNPEEISLLVERTIKVKNLQLENEILRKKLTKKYQFHDIVTKNARMQDILTLTREVASLRSTVLIHGASGTGKELVARAIHYSGDRARQPFITLGCAALAETLLESELFGYEKGAFTGAGARTKGKFEMAGGGTLFLDEIGDISPKLQADLLRVLQERRFYRVGGGEEVRVDARIIAATNKDLAVAVREGRFRNDLYYRLNVIEISIPPLCDRREDIPLLATHFIGRLARELGRSVEGVTEGGLRALLDYDWPGNVRELENAIERAVVTARATMLAEEDFAFLHSARESAPWVVPPNISLQDLERQAIAATLERTAGNIKEAAAVLGIDRSTLYEKIKRYAIPR